MPAPRVYQHTFGRSAQTKIMDAVWNHRPAGISIKKLSQVTRNGYQYTVIIVKELARRNLITKEKSGVESLIHPNMEHPIVQGMAEMSN